MAKRRKAAAKPAKPKAAAPKPAAPAFSVLAGDEDYPDRAN
jgi:hypothetical protein